MDDLDALIAEHRSPASKTTSFLRGAGQGATLGFGDEIAGAWDALTKAPADALLGEAPGMGHYYDQGRNEARQLNAQAQGDNPKSYFGGNVVGGAGPAALATIATGGAAALPIALGEGALTGLGSSDESSFGGLARDTGAGTAAGLAGYGVGALMGKTLKSLVGKAGQKASAAVARAEEQGVEDIAAQRATLSGQYGAATQKGSRYIENLMRLEGSMTPEQRALYQELHANGVVPNLQHQVAQSTLEELPAQAGDIASKKAALEAFQASEPEALRARIADLRKPQFRKDASSFAKAYAEPVVAMGLAHAAGLGPAGEAAAGLMFGRTRAGKAIMSRINRPGNAEALWNFVHKASDVSIDGGSLGNAFRRALTGAAVAPAAAYGASALDERSKHDAEIDAEMDRLIAEGIPVLKIKTPMLKDGGK